MKIIYTLIFASALCFTPMLVTQSEASSAINDVETQPISFSQSGSTLTIYGATGKTLYIYNLIGVQVAAIRIDSPEKRIDLSNLPHGIYPVKIGNVAKKIRL